MPDTESDLEHDEDDDDSSISNWYNESKHTEKMVSSLNKLIG